MKKTLLSALSAALITACSLFAGHVYAADDCEAKAVDKNGKALAGAAKTSFMKKCGADAGGAACEAKAVDKNGKALVGAAKTSSIKKCNADMAAAKK
jgi:opacity protein-like surface antigen